VIRAPIIVLASCGALAGCGMGPSLSNLASSKLSNLAIPDIHLIGVPLYDERPGTRLERTKPYSLSPSEKTAVRLAVAASLSPLTKIVFYPLRSGVTADGTVAVCGVATVRSIEGALDQRLFRGDLVRQKEPDSSIFSVMQISGANATSIEIYGKCHAQGLA